MLWFIQENIYTGNYGLWFSMVFYGFHTVSHAFTGNLEGSSKFLTATRAMA